MIATRKSLNLKKDYIIVIIDKLEQTPTQLISKNYFQGDHLVFKIQICC